MPKHKVLKSVAHNTAHSFTSMMNYWVDDYVMGHLLVAARSTGKSDLEVDLLSGQASPQELLVVPVRETIRAYCADFPLMVTRSGSLPEFVAKANMRVTFDLTRTRPYSFAPHLIESPFECEVQILDDQGKKHVGGVSGWWCPESTRRTTLWQRIRSWFTQG